MPITTSRARKWRDFSDEYSYKGHCVEIYANEYVHHGQFIGNVAKRYTENSAHETLDESFDAIQWSETETLMNKCLGSKSI